MAYKLTTGWPLHIESGSFVNPETNQEYLAWLAEGNTPEPADPAPIPTVVTMRQARLALLQANLLSTVNTAIKAGNEEDKITWEYATEVYRNSPLVTNMVTALGLSDSQLDDLFALAATL